MFSEGPSIFEFFCYNGILGLLRNVVDLQVSLAMSPPAETIKKLSMSRLEFLILVMQSSNGCDVISFFWSFV